MYFKLASQNVKKSFRDYLIYFLTLAFSVCLFYTFNSFQSQQAVLDMNQAQADIIPMIDDLMKYLSFIIAFILAFLIIYANNFLIKRRKKELGLYTLLGMERRKISKILVYETFIIGLVSLVVGLAGGVLASQLLTVVTANLFEAKLNYSFIFSMDATLITIAAFAIIFIIIMIFNSFILNRYKLIDLLTADKKNESLKVKNIYVSVVMFLVSLVLLGYAYTIAWNNGYEAFSQLGVIVPCGLLGTLFFFMSLSGFLLKFVQTSKNLYYRNLNMFVLRQINASINSNFISMSVVCVMLLFSIGALATGFNLNKALNSTVSISTPYDISYSGMYRNYDFAQLQKTFAIDTSAIKEQTIIYEYASDVDTSAFVPYIKNESNAQSLANQPCFEVLKLSDFNAMRERLGLDTITLTEQEAYLFTSSDALGAIVDDVLAASPSFTLYGHDFKIQNKTYDLVNLATTRSMGTFMFGVVIKDDLIPADAQVYSSYWNIDLQNDVDQLAFYNQLEQSIGAYDEAIYQQQEALLLEGNKDEYNRLSGERMPTMYLDSADDVKANSNGLSVVMTYIGIYLGLIFLIASAVILALQQLSQASDNVQRYRILTKIGAEKRMLSHSVFLQLCIYFMMPLLLAIVHSYIGIHVVNQLVMMFGKGDIFASSLITGGAILGIYGAYFLVTYIGYKRILAKN